jgi:hypothetical protein
VAIGTIELPEEYVVLNSLLDIIRTVMVDDGVLGVYSFSGGDTGSALGDSTIEWAVFHDDFPLASVSFTSLDTLIIPLLVRISVVASASPLLRRSSTGIMFAVRPGMTFLH